MRVAAGLLALALAPASWAQEVILAPSAAMGCLTPAADQRGAPTYPFDALKFDKKGRVKVELSFTTPTTRPAVQVLEQEGDDSFVDAVKDHVRAFRVPCHDGGDLPARLSFDYVFRPDDRRVHWARPVDADDDARRALVRCVKHQRGRSAPTYPMEARRQGLQGRVLAVLRFEAPDQPPVAQVFARPSAGLLREEIERWVAGYRMPCHAGAPVSTEWSFVFRIEGERAFGFVNSGLLNFLRHVRDIDKKTVAFDFNQMACPFDVSLRYRQPYLPSSVGEVGSTDPTRRPFLDWLATLELDLAQGAQDAVFGDVLAFDVPCLKIDLKPKEKS